jgi:glycosyltransferase involved in cell wall biosynthesis
MRIAIDARELVGAATGAGRYLAQILAHWADLPGAAQHEFVLYAHGPIDGHGRRLQIATRMLPGAGGTRWEQVTLAAALRRDGPDVLFAPAYTAPLLAATPTVLAVHDVSFAAHPEWFRPREGARRRFVTARAARRARTVLTLSAFSKTEIVRHLGVAPERVRVVPIGLGIVGDARGPSDEGPRGSLVLFVGSIFNRRHVPALIRAMPAVAARHPQARLAIVGENRSWPREDLAAIAAGAGVEDRVALEAFVSDDELRERYREAAVFVFLSEYEGFGLTPLEALASGVPVVLLDTPVAREVCGSAARYVTRPDPGEVAAAILDLLGDRAARRDVRAAAGPVLARYRWTDAAAVTLATIEEAGTP